MQHYLWAERRPEQLEILNLFGTVDFDPTYDYKKNRQLDQIPFTPPRKRRK